MQCVGLEVQEDRFRRAVRSVEYNLGAGQSQVTVFHRDLCGLSSSVDELEGMAFDAITGTPPYFDGELLGQPGEKSAAGCIFELRGGVEEYCAAASRVMQRPCQAAHPCLLILCQTALSSDRVYRSCADLQMTVLRRVDVIPKETKEALFCVFVITPERWAPHFSFMAGNGAEAEEGGGLVNGRAAGSVAGELVEALTVRRIDLSHTREYADILASLGKPSSRDK